MRPCRVDLMREFASLLLRWTYFHSVGVFWEGSGQIRSLTGPHGLVVGNAMGENLDAPEKMFGRYG